MFGIENLNSRIIELEQGAVKAKEIADIEITKLRQEIIDLRNEFTKTIDKLLNDTDAKMIEFHRQVAEKYFDTLEKIFRFNKEISLIDKLSQQIGEKDVAKLQASLLQPILETRWKQEELKQGKKIESTWGIKIVERRKELHDRILEMERQGELPEKIAPLKAKLEELEQIIEGTK